MYAGQRISQAADLKTKVGTVSDTAEHGICAYGVTIHDQPLLLHAMDVGVESDSDAGALQSGLQVVAESFW